MIRYTILLFIGGFIFLTACDNKVLPEPPPPALCDTLDLSYNTNIQRIIDKSCAFNTCHDAVGSVVGNFTNYSTMLLFLENGDFKKEIENGSMPLAPGELSIAQKDSLICWLNDGFPEN